METKYSTPLIKKLGIKPGLKIIFINKPAGFSKLLGKLPEKVEVNENLFPNQDLIHYFTHSQKSLDEDFPALKNSISKTGSVWISWPKGACNIRTDLNENIVRILGLKNGLVDVKICSIDSTWSALKFVYRKKDR